MKVVTMCRNGVDPPEREAPTSQGQRTKVKARTSCTRSGAPDGKINNHKLKDPEWVFANASGLQLGFRGWPPVGEDYCCES